MMTSYDEKLRPDFPAVAILDFLILNLENGKGNSEFYVSRRAFLSYVYQANFISSSFVEQCVIPLIRA